MKIIKSNTSHFGWGVCAKQAFLLAIMMIFSLSSLAQISRAPIALGPFDLEASLFLAYAQDDNLYQTAADEVDTPVVTLMPELALLFDNGVSGFSVNYTAEDVHFSDESEADFTDHQVELAMGTSFAEVHRIELRGLWTELHDRQTIAADNANSSPNFSANELRLDYFRDIDYFLTYTLGGEQSLLNAMLSAGEFEREYLDNRSLTRALDRAETHVAAELHWNISSVFRPGLYYSNTDIAYEIANPSRDGEAEISALTLFWQAFSTLELDVRLGQTQRDNDLGNTDDSTYWDASLRWAPLSYSVFSASSSQYTDESGNQAGDFVLSNALRMTWRHDWSDRFRTSIGYAEVESDYLGSEREDKRRVLDLDANYGLSDRLDIGLFLNKAESRSNSADVYDQNIYGLSLLLRL